jgi:hypothetical protein
MIKVLLTIPRVLFPWILFTIFSVNFSVDRGQSSKCETFHPQVSSNLAYVNIRMALSGSSSTAVTPWESLKYAFRKVVGGGFGMLS